MRKIKKIVIICMINTCFLFTFSINGQAAGIQVGNASMLIGDVNGDGVVDIKDYNLEQGHLYENDPKYDLNSDNKVDLLDLSIISSNINSNFTDNSYVSIGNTIGNISNSSFIVKQGNMIYYRNTSDNGKLYTSNLNREFKRKLSEDIVSCINIYGNSLYYLNLNDGSKIYKINLDGTGRVKIVDDNCYNFEINDGWIYYRSTTDSNKLYRVRVDGSNKVKIIDYATDNFLVKDNSVYYINNSLGGSLYKVSVDGSNNTCLISDRMANMILTSNSIYYINSSDNRLYSTDLSGANRKRILDESIVNFNISNEKIYYSNYADNKLYMTNIDATNKIAIGNEVLPTDRNQNRINVINNSIVYTNGNDGNRLYEINSDGMNKREFDYSIIGYAKVDGIKLRSNPDYSVSSNVIATLSNGKTMEVIDSGIYSSGTSTPEKWYKVNCTINSSLVTGFVYAANILILNDDRMNNMLGVLSANYESNGDPGIISSGIGDVGGKSYGAWQLASNVGSVDSFLLWLRTKNNEIYTRLTNAKNRDGGVFGTNFDNEWKNIANTEKESFLNLQHDYIKFAYYDNTISQMGIDESTKSFAYKNVIWSTAVQHGSSGAMNIFRVVGMNRADRDFISAVYDERSKVDIYFKNCSQSVKDGVKARFVSEKSDALIMFDNPR